MTATESFNLIDPWTFQNGHPFDAYDEMRKVSPVYRNCGSEMQPEFWVLTRHQDIRAVSGDGENFSSEKQGCIIPSDSLFKLNPRIQEDLARFMINLDDPLHMHYRKLLMKPLSPKELVRIEGRIKADVDELIEGLRGRDEIDFVAEVAEVPIKTICAIMGVPKEDEWRVLGFTNAVFGVDDPDYSPTLQAANEQYLDVIDYGWNLAQARRQDPRDDVMSIVAHAKVDGQRLSRTDQTSFFTNAIAAGNETTRSSLAGAIALLARHPDQRKLLVDSPGLIESALDELLRMHTPGIHFCRTANRDVELGGTTIRGGERVAMLYGAGNYDPSIFPDPYCMDLRRENARDHLAFGFGVHHCLGFRLARLQLRLILTAFLHEFPDYEVVEEPTMVISNLVHAMKTLKVSLNS